jgi:hypothetical protein
MGVRRGVGPVLAGVVHPGAGIVQGEVVPQGAGLVPPGVGAVLLGGGPVPRDVGSVPLGVGPVPLGAGPVPPGVEPVPPTEGVEARHAGEEARPGVALLSGTEAAAEPGELVPPGLPTGAAVSAATMVPPAAVACAATTMTAGRLLPGAPRPKTPGESEALRPATTMVRGAGRPRVIALRRRETTARPTGVAVRPLRPAGAARRPSAGRMRGM